MSVSRRCTYVWLEPNFEAVGSPESVWALAALGSASALQASALLPARPVTRRAGPPLLANPSAGDEVQKFFNKLSTNLMQARRRHRAHPRAARRAPHRPRHPLAPQMRDQRVAHVSHIQLEASNANMGQLVAWKEKIGNDEEAFASIATQHSACRSAAKGGDLGYLTRGERAPRAPPPPGHATHPPPRPRAGRLSKEFDDVIFEEQPGAVYGPIRTQFGLHLIFVHSCRDGGNPDDPQTGSLGLGGVKMPWDR